MNRYFLKIHPVDHFAGGFGHSRNESDWEGGEIILPPIGRVYPDAGQREPIPGIRDGDELWIWIHEGKGGRGLTAKAAAGAVKSREDGDRVVLKTVELVPSPFDYSGFPKKPENGHETGSRVLDYASIYRPSKGYLIEDADYQDFANVVERHGWNEPRTSQAAPQDIQIGHAEGWAREVLTHKDDLLAGLKDRRTTTLKPRPGQAQFRETLMERYQGRCAISKCAIPEALEAAHVMPHTGDPKWDHPDNGMMLRRDLHALFDAMLWSIDPKTSRVRVAEKLKTTSYRKLDGRDVDHRVAPELLEVHFRQFKKGGSHE